MSVGRDRSLSEIFAPASVAVIGASGRPGSVGSALFRNILTSGFQGVVYPVNPNHPSVSGVRCYPSIADLPEVPDLGVVIVPAAKVPGVARELGRAGCKGLIVISAGFKEIGGAGRVLEERLRAEAERYRMSLVGPNCFGVLNTAPETSLNATFSDDLPPRGNIAFISQSGALCAGILRYGISERIGFSRFVSVGNRAGVDENDLLHSLGQDAATRVILLYVESLAEGRRFLEAALEVTEHKPVLVIKSGRSPAGERAAQSHTGSLARSGQDRLYDALFEQSGVLRIESIGELFRASKVLATGARLEGPHLAILTNSGGPGIVAADACARLGLDLPAPAKGVADALRTQLSPSAGLGNPIDMTADAGAAQYREALRLLLASPDINGAIVIATPTGLLTGKAAAQAILEGRGSSSKPIAACLFGLTDLSREVGALEDRGIPTFTFPEEAVGGLSSLARYHAWANRPRTSVRRFPVDRRRVRALLRGLLTSRTRVLPEFLARELLTAYGIRFAPSAHVTSLAEAMEAADTVGYPVALKVASADISHKTEVGGVTVGIGDPTHLRSAWETMQRALAEKAPRARIDGFEIERMIIGGKEVLVGLQQDPAFGPVLVFGMGGIYVEVLKDITFRLAPVRTLSVRNMVASVRAFPLLLGVRGEAPSDLEALYEVIERVSQLATENPEVLELDLNPLILERAGEGIWAVDARVVLGPSSRSAPSTSARRSGTGRPRTPRPGGPRPRRR